MTSTILIAFKARVEGYLSRTGMSPATFGRLAINDGSFVADMREGRREFRLSTIEAVDKFMAEHQPAADTEACEASGEGAAQATSNPVAA